MITGLTNTGIKRLVNLQQNSRARREAGVFVAEGRRELLHCIEGGYHINTIYCCRDISGDVSELTANLADVEVVDVSRAVYDKVAYRDGTEGVIAIVNTPVRTLHSLELPASPLLLVLEGVEKPGNLGAVLRSADAAGADAVIVCEPLTDIYNPNVIRSSIGAVFTVPTVTCTTAEGVDFLKNRGIQILTAQLQDSKPYYNIDMTVPTAIVMGTEATGLTTAWREAADAHILIPMNGRLDSLNVAVSASILVYEAVRQRQSRC